MRRDLQDTVTFRSCFATAQTHTFCFGLTFFDFVSFCFNFVFLFLFQFCFLFFFYESAKTSANVNKLKSIDDVEDVACCCF